MAATSEERILVKNALSTAYSLKFMPISNKTTIIRFYSFLLEADSIPNVLKTDASMLLSKPVVATIFFERSASYVKDVTSNNSKLAKAFSKGSNLNDCLNTLRNYAKNLDIARVSEEINFSKISSAVSSIEGHLDRVNKAKAAEVADSILNTESYELEENGQNVDGITAQDLLNASDMIPVDELEGDVDLSALDFEQSGNFESLENIEDNFVEISEDDLTEDELAELAEQLENEEYYTEQQSENTEEIDSTEEIEDIDPEYDEIIEEASKFVKDEPSETYTTSEEYEELEAEESYTEPSETYTEPEVEENIVEETKTEENTSTSKDSEASNEEIDKDYESRKAWFEKNYSDKVLNAVTATIETYERLYQSAYSPILPGGLLTTSGFIECDIEGKADGAEAYDEKKFYNKVLDNRIKSSDVPVSDAMGILKAIQSVFGDAYDYVQAPGAEPNINSILKAKQSGKTLIYPSIHLKAMYGAFNFCLGRTTGLRHYLHSVGNTKYDTKTKVSEWLVMRGWLTEYITHIYYKALLDRNLDRQDSNYSASDRDTDIDIVLNAMQDSLKHVVVVSEFKNRINTKVKIATNRADLKLPVLLQRLKSSFNMGTSESIKIQQIGKVQHGVIEINIIKNEKAFSQSELFAYQVLPEMQKQGIVPSWSNIILGQDDNGMFMQSLVGDKASVVNVYAGMGSGKGVMTLNLICAALADKAELLYIDAKPDSALALTRAAWSRGVDVGVINGMEITGKLIDLTGINPPRDIKDTEYQANIPEGIFTAMTDEQGKESGLGERTAAQLKRDFLLFVQYLKAFEFYIKYCEYRAAHPEEYAHGSRLVVIFDELQQLCNLELNLKEQMQACLDKIKKETVEVDGKRQKIDYYKDPRYLFITNFFAWCEALKTKATTASKSTLRKANTTGIYIWQTSTFPKEPGNASVISSFLLKMSSSSIKCIGYGGVQERGSSVFGTPSTLKTAKVSWYERVNRKGMGYWAIGENVEKDTEMHVFKPYKVFATAADKKLLIANASANGLTERDLIGVSLNPDGSVVQETGFEAYASKLLALAGLDLGQQLNYGLQRANKFVQETKLGRDFFDVIYQINFASTVTVEADALEDGEKVNGSNRQTTAENDGSNFDYSKITNSNSGYTTEPRQSSVYEDNYSEEQTSNNGGQTSKQWIKPNTTYKSKVEADDFEDYNNDTDENEEDYIDVTNTKPSNFNMNMNDFTEQTGQNQSRNQGQQFNNRQNYYTGQDSVNRATEYKTNITNKPMKCKTFASLTREEQEANINRVIAELTKPFNVTNRESKPFGLVHLCWNISILFYSRMLDVNQLAPEMQAFASNYAERLKSKFYPLDYIPTEAEVQGLMTFMDTTVENGAFVKREKFNNLDNNTENSNKDLYAEAYKQHAKFEELRQNVNNAYSVGQNGRNNINLDALRVKPILLNDTNSVSTKPKWYGSLWQNTISKSNKGVSYLFSNRTNCVIDSILRAIPDKRAVTTIVVQDCILTVNGRLVDTDSLIDDEYGIRFEDFVNIKKILKVFRNVQKLSLDYQMYLQLTRDYGADVQSIWGIFQENNNLIQLEVQLNPGTTYEIITRQNYKEHLKEIQESANLAKLRAGMEQMSAQLNPRIADKGLGYRRENGISERVVQSMSKGARGGMNISGMGKNLVFTEQQENFHPVRGAMYGALGLGVWSICSIVSSPFRLASFIRRMSN